MRFRDRTIGTVRYRVLAEDRCSTGDRRKEASWYMVYGVFMLARIFSRSYRAWSDFLKVSFLLVTQYF